MVDLGRGLLLFGWKTTRGGWIVNRSQWLLVHGNENIYNDDN